MSLVSTEYRLLTLDDFEQAAEVEQRAFYNTPAPDYAERLRKYFLPEWTVGAFVDGKLVADTRTIPHHRRMHGATMGFGAVGPVACLAPYRRQGHVNKLLTLALEIMRDRGQVLSGLFTPHDALYQRFGWERAEFKKRYKFPPKGVTMRVKGARGRTLPVTSDDWQRLDAIYQAATKEKNGPFVRNEVWWREAIFRHWDAGGRADSDAVVWVDGQDRDQGFAVYWHLTTGREGGWERKDVWLDQIEALTTDAYLGLWSHMLTHDLIEHIVTQRHPNDPFKQLCEPPEAVEAVYDDGPMIRVTDVENAINQRPYVGGEAAAATLRIADPTLPFNDGTWRIQAADAKMLAERTDARPDAELSVNTLAALFTGYLNPEWAVASGFMNVERPEIVGELTRLFAVSDPPFSSDHY